MAGCDGFEIGIEKRLRGALAAREGAALDAHLAGCSSCRAYAAEARDEDAALQGAARSAWAAVERGRLARRLEPGLPPVLRGAAVVVAVVAWVGVVVWLSTTAPLRGERMVRSIPAASILAVLALLVLGYRSRRLAALADRDDALEAYRHAIVADLTWGRRMQWALAGLVAFFLYRALGGHGAAGYDRAVYFGGLALPLAAGWLALRRGVVPRAAREARDLWAAGSGGRR